ncbi:angiopoietin-related protein 7-like isoform X2 [Physella acuta]|uniref:angiopoietin-related protein 7-like isoform X2 n=1 Tax=Physella acuta TaxID=109671 RepID=UPI0027DB78EA|nr:angiopoietin-related protein 7-like isoform X2 [Physella acuta]
MIFPALYMFIAVNIISSTGVQIDMNRDYFYHGKDLFCAQLQCTENIREDTQISALVNMSVYRISEPEGKILVASISESDSKLKDYKRAGTRVDGKISKTFSQLDIFFSNHSDCNVGHFLCEIHYVNRTGSIDRIGKQAESLPRKSRDIFLMMNLKAKTSDYVKSVDTMADFLKSFEDPDRLKGADMTMSLQMSHSGGDKFNTDKSFGRTDTELSNSYKHISSSTFEDMLDDKLKNLTLDVNKTLQMTEHKLSSKTELNKNSLAVLNESIQTMLANSQNQTEQLSIRLNENETNIKKSITQENINTTLNLVAGLNKTLQDFINEYYDNPMNLKLTKQCVRNDDLSLPEQMAFKLDQRKLALCDTKTDGGGWIIIQRRVAGDVSFTRNWSDYKYGFGSLAGDYWLGNDIISNLTQNGYSELRFDMKYKGKFYYAVYSNVTVGNEADLYRIKLTYKTGNSTDNFSYHNGKVFSTLDRDNDKSSSNCADNFKGGWWYDSCYQVNLNGVWASKTEIEGIRWNGLTVNIDSLEHVEMKLRRP